MRGKFPSFLFNHFNHSSWALYYATVDAPPEIFEILTQHKDVVTRLVDLLKHPNVEVQTPAIRTVGNLLTGNEEQTEVIISCGVLPSLANLFEHPKREIRKEVMWALSNVTAVAQHIQSVIDAEIFPKLFIMLSPARNETADVKKEMYYTVINALAGGKDTQIQYLIDQGVIQQLCDGLDMDSPVLSVLLQGLEKIMTYGTRTDKLEEICHMIEECGGVERIEALQEHNDENIYQQAVHILEYWQRMEMSHQIEFGPVSDDEM